LEEDAAKTLSVVNGGAADRPPLDSDSAAATTLADAAMRELSDDGGDAAAAAPTTPPAGPAWTPCASEGEACDCHGVVRYGHPTGSTGGNVGWLVKPGSAGPTTCAATSFGDVASTVPPAGSTASAAAAATNVCECLASNATPRQLGLDVVVFADETSGDFSGVARPDGRHGWTRCAGNGETCACPAGGAVRIGNPTPHGEPQEVADESWRSVLQAKHDASHTARWWAKQADASGETECISETFAMTDKTEDNAKDSFLSRDGVECQCNAHSMLPPRDIVEMLELHPDAELAASLGAPSLAASSSSSSSTIAVAGAFGVVAVVAAIAGKRVAARRTAVAAATETSPLLRAKCK
jgi:hypothetical protein